MNLPKLTLTASTIALAWCMCSPAKASPANGREAQQFQLQVPALSPAIQPRNSASGITPAEKELLAFRNSEVKFNVQSLMDLLKDHRHEGWVLTAYPDPKTHLPLIGAGFSLDLPARDHSQQDTLNPHQFLEPSSAELWQAAGLDPEVLQTILRRYNTTPAPPVRHKSRHKRRAQVPDITSDQATKLLHVAVIQAIYNARAYCRNFDSLTAAQQMAMTQLVYQMGVNLESFNRFLFLMNDDSAAILTYGPGVFDADHWDDVQAALVQSQWARSYRARAVSVIAMLNPEYPDNPVTAEQNVSAALPAAIIPAPETQPHLQLRAVSYRKHASRQRRRQAGRSRKTI